MSMEEVLRKAALDINDDKELRLFVGVILEMSVVELLKEHKVNVLDGEGPFRIIDTSNMDDNELRSIIKVLSIQLNMLSSAFMTQGSPFQRAVRMVETVIQTRNG